MISNWRCAAVVAVLCLAGPVQRMGARPAQPELAPAAAIDDLQWLVGTWRGTAGTASVEEHWTRPDGGAMLGLGRTVRQGRMVAFEFLRIITRGAAIVYVAQPGGRPATEFPMTSSGANVAVFENPAHDHPTLIRYRRTGNALTAEVEGTEQGKPVREVYRFTLTQ